MNENSASIPNQELERESLAAAQTSKLDFASLQGSPRPQARQSLTKSRRLFIISTAWIIFSVLLVGIGMSYYVQAYQGYSQLHNEALNPSTIKPPDIRLPLAVAGLGLLGILIGVFRLSNAFLSLNILNKLDRQGLEAQAIIYDKWQDPSSDGSLTSLVAFAFEISTPRGTQCIRCAEDNPKAYQALNLGDQTRVKYLPNDPEASLLVDFR